MNIFRLETTIDVECKRSNISPVSVTQDAPFIVPTNLEIRQRRHFQKARCARTDKNRKIVNGILKYVGQQVNMELSLCAKGICYFQFKQFVIVIEVPIESDSIFLYSMVFGLRANDDRFSILQNCMQLNYMKQATRGSTLGLNGDEVNLCYSCSVAGLTRDSLLDALENFILTAVHVNKQLDAVSR